MIRTSSCVLLSLTVSACSGAAPRVGDPIPDVPATQQRRISRPDFADTWPFEPGTGTLGCAASAVVFRAQGVTYALNDQARAAGYVSADSILVSQSKAPSRPLKRIVQDERMRIFRSFEECASVPDPVACKQRLAQSHGVSAEELAQIDAEGRERSWPPLSPPRKNTAAIVKAGAALCSR